MTKSSTLTEAIIPVAVVEAAPALPVKRPYAIQLTEPIDVVLQKAAILIKHHSYVPCAQTPTSVFGITGMMTITLVQGSVDEAFIPAAEAEIEQAAAAERAQYERDVAEAARLQIKAKVDAEIAARKAALVADQKRQLAALEAEIAANSK